MYVRRILASHCTFTLFYIAFNTNLFKTRCTFGYQVIVIHMI